MNLYEVDLKTLMSAVADRLTMIEAGDLERDLLRASAPSPTEWHARLSRLVRTARDYVAAWPTIACPEGAALEAALADLANIVVAGDRDADAPDDPESAVGAYEDDILKSARDKAVVEQRYAELQRLYTLRMDFTRDEITRVRAETCELRGTLVKERAAHQVILAERDNWLDWAAREND